MVAIVTFSPQANLIKDVLRTAFPDCAEQATFVFLIVIVLTFIIR